MNDSLRFSLYTTFTVLCGVALFGGLFVSLFTEESKWFVFGYPVAVLFLIAASLCRKVKK